MSTAIPFAFTAGLLATVNPCGFAMLPSFLGLYLGDDEGDGRARPLLARLRQGMAIGVILSVTFGGVFVLAGLLISAGLRSVLGVVPWVAVLVGAGLLGLGVAMLAGRRVGVMAAGRVEVRGGASTGYRRVAAFGVAYAVASLSCTLAVFLIVVGQALTVADPLQILAVFGAYAAGSASLLVALSLSAALAKGALAGAVRRLLPVVHRLAGALLVASGAYLLAYWLPPLLGEGEGWAAEVSRRTSSTAATFLQANAGVFATVLGLLAALGAALLVAERRRRASTTRPQVTMGQQADADCCSPSAPAPTRVGAASSD